MARTHFAATVLNALGWGPTLLKPKLDEHDLALDVLESHVQITKVYATAADMQADLGNQPVGTFVLVGAP